MTTLDVTHRFVSAVADGADATVVRPSNWNDPHVFPAPITPQGRLTLASATPVLAATVSGATTVYYAPHVGSIVPIYDGVNFALFLFSELSQATTDTSKSPAAVAANKNYDVFVWNDGGTTRATRGPAWNSDTARGTGAGTTELTRVNGILLNAVAVTNGPAAQRGTYVGTIRSNGASQIDYIFAAAAAGGTAGVVGVWNMYNRVDVRMTVHDNTAGSWTFTSGTIGPMNPGGTGSGLNNRISFVCGLAEDGIAANMYARISAGAAAGAYTQAGFAMDSTTVHDAPLIVINNAASTLDVTGAASKGYAPQLGWHFIQMTQVGDGTHTSAIGGGNQNGLTLSGRF